MGGCLRQRLRGVRDSGWLKGQRAKFSLLHLSLAFVAMSTEGLTVIYHAVTFLWRKNTVALLSDSC